MSEGEIQFALASRWLMENGWGFTVNRFKMKEQLEQLTEKTLTNLVEETVSSGLLQSRFKQIVRGIVL